jgi:hypothetical protein
LGPFLSLDTAAIQLRDCERDPIIDILIQDTHDDNGKRGESKVKEDDVGVIKNILAVEVGVDLVPEKSERPDNILNER